MQYIAYYRVSTDQQGQSGLGLDAQREAVKPYQADILAEYTEIESGKQDNRPQLLAALEHCKRAGAAILIAKLDRLSRDAAFLFTLRKSGVQILAADMPGAGMLEYGVRAIFAQHEREQISARTKAALQAAKAKGARLGCPNPSIGAKVSAARKAAKADQYAETLKPDLMGFLRSCRSYQDLADSLTLAGIKTPSGQHRWSKSSAHAVLKRAGLTL
jgi:DNA invertase Pin-like site-specific DNA recombinase